MFYNKTTLSTIVILIDSLRVNTMLKLQNKILSYLFQILGTSHLTTYPVSWKVIEFNEIFYIYYFLKTLIRHSSASAQNCNKIIIFMRYIAVLGTFQVIFIFEQV